MEFKAGDRVHVTRFESNDVDFYATLTDADLDIWELVNCTDFQYEGLAIYKEIENKFGIDNEDYYTLATDENKGLRWSDGSSAEGTPIMCDEEDTEEPVIQRIESFDKGEIIAHSIISNRDGGSFTSAHDMIMWLNEIEGMHGENISVKGWNLIFDHVKSSIAPAFFGKED